LAINHNANRQWLAGYAADTQYIKDVVITFPMLYDEYDEVLGGTFQAYDSGTLLPSIFLIDQAGIIQIRSDGIDMPDAFAEEMEEILAAIDELLENPPGGF